MKSTPTCSSHSGLRVREFTLSSALYHETLRARDLILRQPLGLKLTEEDTLGEETQRHFALCSDDQVIGGVIAIQAQPETVRLRQMWIDPAHSKRGLGRLLLEDVLAKLTREGAEMVALHAREPVIEFYRKCGFQAEGPTFQEVGIPHRRMTLTINPGKQSPGDHQ